jgi:hypothetical protein
MTGAPKLTVVIPTRERCGVLARSLATVTAQDYDPLEILVSDNCSSDATRDVVAAVRDPRIRYVNTGQRLSMSGNWEFALSHVRGGWVTILGDDDGLLPGALHKVAALIRDTGVQAIRSRVCKYLWPSLTGLPWGKLIVPLERGHEVRPTRPWLERVMSGLHGYAALPILYNGGFVDTALVERIKGGTDTLYRSAMPDVYSAMAICSLVDSYVFSHEPFVISGASKYSTGASHFVSNARRQDASPAQLFRSEEKIPLHPAIPHEPDGSYPMSVHALVYESYLQTAFLRDEAPGPRHAEQLAVILAFGGKHQAAVNEWARRYAAVNGLDYERGRAAAAAIRLRMRFARIPQQVRAAIGHYELGSAAFPLRDVFEATIAAATVRASLPGPVARLSRAAARLVEKRRAKAPPAETAGAPAPPPASSGMSRPEASRDAHGA